MSGTGTFPFHPRSPLPLSAARRPMTRGGWWFNINNLTRILAQPTLEQAAVNQKSSGTPPQPPPAPLRRLARRTPAQPKKRGNRSHQRQEAEEDDSGTSLALAGAADHVSAVLTNTTTPLRPELHHHAQARPTPSGVSPGLHAAALGSVATVPQPAPTVLPAETTLLLPRHTLSTWRTDATTTTDGPAAPPLDSATTATDHSTTTAAATATAAVVSSDLPRVHQQCSAGIKPSSSSVDLGAETATIPTAPPLLGCTGEHEVPTTPRHYHDDGRHNQHHRRRMPSVSSQRGLMRLRTAGAAVEAPSSARKALSASFNSDGDDEPSNGTLSTHGTVWAPSGNSVGESSSSGSTKRGTGEIGRANNRVPATPLRVRLTPLDRGLLLGGADECGGDGDDVERVQRQNNEEQSSLALQRMRTGCGESLMTKQLTLSPSPSPLLLQPSPFPSPSRKRRMGPENDDDDEDHHNVDNLDKDEADQSHHPQQPRSSRRSTPQLPLTKRAKLSRSDFSSPSNSPLRMTNKHALPFPTQDGDDDNTEIAAPSTPSRAQRQQQLQASTMGENKGRRSLYAANVDAGGGSFALAKLPRVGPPRFPEHEQLRHVSTDSSASRSSSSSSSVGPLPEFPTGYFFGALNEAVEALAPFMAVGRGASENMGPQRAGSEGDGTVIKKMVVVEEANGDEEDGSEE